MQRPRTPRPFLALALLTVAILIGGADGCDDDGMVGSLDADGGAGPSTEDGAAPLVTVDAGMVAVTRDDGGTVATDSGETDAGAPITAPDLRRIDVYVANGAGDARIMVSFYDRPAPPSGTEIRRTIETLGSCELATVTPPVSLPAGTPGLAPIDLGAGAVRASIDGAAMLDVPNGAPEWPSYALTHAHLAAGTTIDLELHVPGLAPITRTLVATDIAVERPRLATRWDGLTEALYAVGDDLVIGWGREPLAHGTVGLTLYEQTDTGSFDEVRCSDDYAARSFTVPWRILNGHVLGGPAGSGGFILFNTDTQTETLPGGIMLTMIQSSARQANALAAAPPSP